MAQPSNKGIGVFADFTPIAGDIKGFVDAYNDPSMVNIAAAVIGLAGPIGDGAGKLLKNAEKIGDLKPIHSPGALGNRPDISNLSDADLMRSVTHPENGDLVTVNTQTGGVVDGNTRVTELQRRAADPNSSIDGNTIIPVKPYTPGNSDLPDFR